MKKLFICLLIALSLLMVPIGAENTTEPEIIEPPVEEDTVVEPEPEPVDPTPEPDPEPEPEPTPEPEPDPDPEPEPEPEPVEPDPEPVDPTPEPEPEPEPEPTPEPEINDTTVEGTEESPAFDLKAWFEEKMLPYLLSFLTIVGIALAYLMKPIAAIKKATGKFDSSADVVEASKEICEKGVEALKEYAEKSEEQLREKIKQIEDVAQGYADKLAESEARLAEVLKHVESMSEKIEQMVYLGFTNSPALVGGKGVARLIAEVKEGSYDDKAE